MRTGIRDTILGYHWKLLFIPPFVRIEKKEKEDLNWTLKLMQSEEMHTPIVICYTGDLIN